MNRKIPRFNLDLTILDFQLFGKNLSKRAQWIFWDYFVIYLKQKSMWKVIDLTHSATLTTLCLALQKVTNIKFTTL